MVSHPWLRLPLEEGVVQFLVVDVDLAQLGPHLFSHLGLEAFLRLFFLESLPHLGDACSPDEVGQLERGLLDTTFSLKSRRKNSTHRQS